MTPLVQLLSAVLGNTTTTTTGLESQESLSLSSTIMSALYDFFREDYLEEERHPMVTLHVAGFQLGILQMVWKAWLQLTVLLLMQMVVAALFAVVIYVWIVEPQKKQTQKKQQDAMPYLVGFGLVIPLVLWFPIGIYQTFEFQSTLSCASLICLPMTVSLRCCEAMFGFTPRPAQESLRNFVLYYASLMDTKFDATLHQPVWSTPGSIGKQLAVYVSFFGLNTILLSLLKPFHFTPFTTPLQPHLLQHSWRQMLEGSHLANNFISAVILSTSLSFSLSGVSLLFSLLGVETNPVRQLPLICSSSPSDFWGRRWNNLIHGLLKRGIYKPVRQLWGPTAAVVAAFVASGLVHEYVWLLIFLSHFRKTPNDSFDECRNVWITTLAQRRACFEWQWGKSLIFFSYNALLMLLEKSSIVANSSVVLWMQRRLPTLVKSLLVVALALPVGHLFTGDWIVGGYFDDLSVLFPLVVVVGGKGIENE